ncbi:hypothetical protein DU504_00560 [Haloplanus salinus]|jgi:hypothetical protein|uniref:Uncharacterized protein n=1 Tax=Haloplanus salinus TaxID=1126245 RepID=A0A368N7A9_9EURY|nr:hypothetical protein [Haloplanus salinus]RCU45923.1 hypothetical protein DU504_00560 [Haloplanus salinus]
MPEIEITPEQEERLRALQEDIARDVVGKYGHVRPRDAVEYLLDRHADDEESDVAASAAEPGPDGADADDGSADASAATTRVGADDGESTDGEAGSGGDDAMLNEMMSLLDTHGDKWGESSGDERYQVDLPDGSTEQVRTKDDVKALLFKHYR